MKPPGVDEKEDCPDRLLLLAMELSEQGKGEERGPPALAGAWGVSG